MGGAKGVRFPALLLKITSASKTTLLLLKILLQARLPCAAGPNLRHTWRLVSNKNSKARGRKSKLKSNNFAPHGICFAQRKKFVNQFLLQARLPCAAGPNLPLTRGLVSNKDKIVGGRKSKLKSNNFAPHGICFAQQKKCVN